jgi:hypothetical protein
MYLYITFLTKILIICFGILIIYQVFLAHFRFKEGLEQQPSQYTDYDFNNPNNALILSQQNAGNIAFLKSQVDSLIPLQKQVSDISGNLILLSDQVNDIVLQQTNYATQNLPSSPPDISGASFEDSTPVADSSV